MMRMRCGVAGLALVAGCGGGNGGLTTPADQLPSELVISIEAPEFQPAGRDTLVKLLVDNPGPESASNVSVIAELTGQVLSGQALDGGSWEANRIAWPPFSVGAAASRTLRFRLRGHQVGEVVIRASASRGVERRADDLASAESILHLVPGVAITIDAPAAGTSWYLGDTITFAAHTTDHRGDPVATPVRWSSGLDGSLGAGNPLRRHDLRSGQHVVRAIVADDEVSDTATVVTTVSECGPFGSWAASDYVLPYPAGTSYVVNQSNCSGFGHSGFWKHGYDFIMDIGTEVAAARSGVVGWATDGCSDGNATCTNLITIIHADGTVALYSHLTPGGVLVEPGHEVAEGQLIGRSGNTGNTGGLPHLHFSLHPCNELPGLPGATDCPTIPVNFRSTTANPYGPQAGRAYTAE